MGIVHSHLPGIVIREIFRIVGPALGVAAVVEKIPESRCFHFPKILSAVNSLVEMPGIAFMGQGGIERQVIMEIASVHTDYSDIPRKPQVMKTVTVETFGVDYDEPETL